jgi:hypothetical protein
LIPLSVSITRSSPLVVTFPACAAEAAEIAKAKPKYFLLMICLTFFGLLVCVEALLKSIWQRLQNGYRECIKTGRWSGPVTGSGALGVAVVFRGQAQNVPICLYNYDKKE